MDKLQILKALADETRMKIITMLLEHNHCVRSLAMQLQLSESAISQQLKILKEAGLIYGEKRGYYMHYDVNRELLIIMAKELEKMAAIKKEVCGYAGKECQHGDMGKCHNADKHSCSAETKEFCHGSAKEGGCHHGHGIGGCHHGHGNCHHHS